MNIREHKRFVAAWVLMLGAAAGPSAQARGAEVQWSVTIGAPAVMLPAPVVVVPVPRPQPVVVPVYPVGEAYRVQYREPTHWDVDGDGIPNRYDRLYNPRWDRNANGIPDRKEFRHHPYGDRDRDGIPNRYDRRDDRYERHDRYEHHPPRDWRGHR